MVQLGIKENQGFGNKAETQYILGNEPNLLPYLEPAEAGIRMTFLVTDLIVPLTVPLLPNPQWKTTVEKETGKPQKLEVQKKRNCGHPTEYVLMGDEQPQGAKLAAQQFLQVCVTAEVQKTNSRKSRLSFACL